MQKYLLLHANVRHRLVVAVPTFSSACRDFFLQTVCSGTVELRVSLGPLSPRVLLTNFSLSCKLCVYNLNLMSALFIRVFFVFPFTASRILSFTACTWLHCQLLSPHTLLTHSNVGRTTINVPVNYSTNMAKLINNIFVVLCPIDPLRYFDLYKFVSIKKQLLYIFHLVP